MQKNVAQMNVVLKINVDRRISDVLTTNVILRIKDERMTNGVQMRTIIHRKLLTTHLLMDFKILYHQCKVVVQAFKDHILHIPQSMSYHLLHLLRHRRRRNTQSKSENDRTILHHPQLQSASRNGPPGRWTLTKITMMMGMKRKKRTLPLRVPGLDRPRGNPKPALRLVSTGMLMCSQRWKLLLNHIMFFCLFYHGGITSQTVNHRSLK